MRRSSAWLLAPFVLLLMVGCSTLTGRYISGAPADCRRNWVGHTSCEAASGVPYALSRPNFKIDRKTTVGGKKGNPVYDVTVDYKADPSRRFEVGMSRGWLTNDTFELTLDASGRATALNSARADQVGRTTAALISAGGSAAALALRSMMSVAEGPTLIQELCAVIRNRGAAIGQPACTPEDTAIASELAAAEEKCATLKPHECDRLKAPILKKVGALVKRARGILAVTVCPAGEYAELAAPPAVSPELKADWKTIDKGEQLARGGDSEESESSKQLARTLKRLRDNADAAIADAAADPTNQAAQAKMIQATKQLSEAVELIIRADDSLQKRGLGDRRDALVAFLKKPVMGRGYGEAYQQYAAALRDLDGALDTIVPKPPAPGGDLADASEVTSRIDTRVRVERYCKPPTALERAARIELAQIEIGLGCARAIVMVAPETIPGSPADSQDTCGGLVTPTPTPQPASPAPTTQPAGSAGGTSLPTNPAVPPPPSSGGNS